MTRRDYACLHAEVRERMLHALAGFHAEHGARYRAFLACSYRDREGQDKAVADGASQRAFGKSRHNYIPCYAGDLLIEDKYLRQVLKGRTHADEMVYRLLADEMRAQGFLWGGDNPTFIEVGHFEAPVDLETMRRGGSPAWPVHGDVSDSES